MSEPIARIELYQAARAAAVQIGELGKAHGMSTAQNPTLIRLMAALQAYKPFVPREEPPHDL
mgnify:CR=1 FL=1